VTEAARPDPPAGASLALTGIVKRFGGVRALSDASLVVAPGTVHALLGENGAGKTTLSRIAFGMLRPDAGAVRVGGQARAFDSPAQAMAAGVGMVHQHFALVPAMTVAENVSLGGAGRYDARRAAERVAEIGRATGLVLDPAAPVAELSVAVQQRVEIVKALARDARVLILDEPTAVLAPPEIEDLLRWLRAFAESGRSAVLITHKLREAIAVADAVTVLRRGRTVATLPRKAADEDAIARAMLGERVVRRAGVPPRLHDAPAPAVGRHRPDATAVESPPSRPATALPTSRPTVLRARDVSVADERGTIRVRDASCEIRGGEIVGVVGVEGSGQRELLRALAGRLPAAAGTLEIPAAVGFVPEDRHRDALVLDFPLYENVALRDAGRRRGVMPWPALRRETSAVLSEHDVRPDEVTAPARALSGGNQQKLVLGRELAGRPAALVVENPTRGLDIRASAAVLARLEAARGAGTAVVVYSSDLDEVLTLADRVLVVHAGAVHEVPPDRERVGRAMLGVW
jgi:general nucleoside transport system ATP-binding protein